MGLILDNKTYSSRLIIGSGKYKDFEQTKKSLEASGAEIITVAIKRTNIGQENNKRNLLDYITKYCGMFFRR